MRVCPSCHGLYGPDQDQCPKDGATTVHHAQVLIGARLGPYVVRSQISEGGMGVVYAGEHPTLGRRVALKVLRPELSLNDPIVERFVQEARAVNTIGHKNIVNVYDFGRTPFGSFYIVMEYLDGRTVRELLDDAGSIELSQVAFLVDQVGEALSAAHAKGFVHRDVKPENIMVCDRAGQRFVKLLDFGIAKLLTGRGNTAHTGSAMGTPQYMSPEQLEDGHTDHRTDVYSLGVVTYELLAGRLPYGGTTHAAVRQLQLTESPPPPSVCRRDNRLSRTIDAAVLQATNLDPDSRFARVDDFLNAFRGAVADTRARRALAAPSPPRRRAAAPLLIGGGVALVLVVLAGLAAWLSLGTDGPEPPSAGLRNATVAAVPPSARKPRPVVDRALASPIARRRELAVRLLGERKCRGMEPALRAAMLGDEDPRVRRRAIVSLGEMGRVSAETLAALRRALDGHDRRMANPWLRIDIATSLARLGDTTGVASLRKDLAQAEQRMLRTRALEALACARQPAGSALARHLADTVPETRYRRLGYLASSPDRKAAAAARRQLEAALTTGAWDERILAARALAPADPEASRRLLVAALESAPRDLRVRAALELARCLKDARGARDLVESLGSVDDRQGTEIALGLGELRGRYTGVEPALTRAMREDGGGVGLAAAIALLDDC